MKIERIQLSLILVFVLILFTGSAWAQQPIPKLTIGVDQADSPKHIRVTLTISGRLSR